MLQWMIVHVFLGTGYVLCGACANAHHSDHNPNFGCMCDLCT